MRAIVMCLALAACGGEAELPDGAISPTSDVDSAVADVVDLSGDAAKAAPDDAAMAPFAVGAVPGLALWLDAAKGITLHGDNYVRYWADQSPNHNDGTSGEPHPVEEPTQVMSSINGLPTLHFTPGPYTTPDCESENCGAGTNIMINDSPSLQWGTGDFLIEVVGKYTNADPHSPQDSYAGTFFFRSSTNGPWLRGNSYPTTPSTSISGMLTSKFASNDNELDTQKTGFNDGKPRLIALQRVGTVLTIRINGVVTDTKTFATALDLTAGKGDILVTVGAAYSDEDRLDGDIAELVAVKGPIASADVRGIESYLLAKYAL